MESISSPSTGGKRLHAEIPNAGILLNRQGSLNPFSRERQNKGCREPYHGNDGSWSP